MLFNLFCEGGCLGVFCRDVGSTISVYNMSIVFFNIVMLSTGMFGYSQLSAHLFCPPTEFETTSQNVRRRKPSGMAPRHLACRLVQCLDRIQTRWFR